MKSICYFISFFIFILFMTSEGYGLKEYEIIQNTEKGSINWTKGIIQAEGNGVPSEKYYGNPVARSIAEEGAIRIAYQNLLETVKKIQINSAVILGDLKSGKNSVMARVRDMIHEVNISKKQYLSDGAVEITIQMNMYGRFNEISLPDEIKEINSIKPLNSLSLASNNKPSSINFTGLIVDARGLDVKPALTIKILNENRDEIYGSAYVSREFAVKNNMSLYLKNFEAALKHKRVADHPFIVRALKTAGTSHSDIIISNAEAAKLRGFSETLSFLKKCRVIIVLNKN
ncbi:Flagellar assembly protein T C-terminal domain-containing protein [Candidatus Magnetomoraceae bacterium gMMP-15]